MKTRFFFHSFQDISATERDSIARVVNIINALAKHHSQIYETIIVYMYEASLDYSPTDLLEPAIHSLVLSIAESQLEAAQEN